MSRGGFQVVVFAAYHGWAPMLRVQVVKPDGSPQLHTFTKAEIMIGRRPDNDLVLAGQDVSGSHACLQVEGDRVTLFDLRSTNGTFVNGQRIPASVELGADDEVTISVFSLRAGLTDLSPRRAAPAIPGPDEDPPPLPELPPAQDLRRVDPEPPPVVHDLGDGPPLVRSSSSRPPPAEPDPVADFDADAPPLVSRPRVSAAPPAKRTVVADTQPPRIAASSPPSPVGPLAAPSNLAQAWQDPTVRRLFIVGLTRVEVERDGVRLPVGHAFTSQGDLTAQLGAVCGQAICCSVAERVLADGTVIQATETSEHGPYIVITRPRTRRVVGLDALVQDNVLPSAAAELLSACARARLPVLLAALPGAATGALVTALLGATSGPSAYVRGLPTAVLTPRGCAAFDAGYGEGRMASVVRLARASDVQWLGVDEPEPAALDECAWAVADGCGVVLGLRAESLQHALRRARAVGVGADGPAIPYALVALLASAEPGRTSLHWLGEPQPGDGPNNVHELFTTDRRGALVTTAVPRLLTGLGERGIHLAETLFTPT
jgi:hypothetical protein